MSAENNKEEIQTQDYKSVQAKSKIPNVTIINVVLLVGLLVLYALRFLPANPAGAEANGMSTEAGTVGENMAGGAFNIAYVNSDTLMAQFELAKKMRADYEAEQRKLENDLKRKQTSFQEDVESFQRQIQLGLVTQEAGQAKEQELMLRQQDLVQLNDTYTNQLMMKELEMNRELYNKITDLLERYNTEMNYDYILGFSPGGGILYAHQRHDITAEIVKRLNQENNVQK